jgi:DNA-binding transcriptional ArsR family regulator
VRVTERQVVRVFRALGDPTRYRIVRLLAAREEVACRELAKRFRLSAPALSHHFRVLEECGLLRVRKEGPYHYFRLNRAVLREALSRWGRWEAE